MQEKPQTYIFFGRSGSGKGTQAQFLIDHLEANNRKSLYVETGREFRDFMGQSNHTAALTKKVITDGELVPVFVPVWIWAEKFVRFFDGTQDLILDGLARRMTEAPVLDSALKFYGRDNCKVLHVNVSREEAKRRLMGRGRPDDTDEDAINERLAWYDRDVLDVMDYFADKKGYEFIDINGEQPREEVFAEIKSKLNLE